MTQNTQLNLNTTNTMEVATMKIQIANTEVVINIPAALSVSAIKEVIAPVFPQVANMVATVVGNVVSFNTVVGVKGSEAPELKIVKFGDNDIPVPAELSVDQIKELLTPVFPRIASSYAVEEDGVVKFFVEAGEKGSEDSSDETAETATSADSVVDAPALKIVKFGDNDIPVPAELSVDQIKELLTPVFPRIASSYAVEEDGVVKFFVEAGEKGSEDSSDETAPALKIVKFGDNDIPVPAELSIDQIKELLTPVFPRIASSYAVEEDGVVKFFVEAGEKGCIRFF